MPPPGRVARPRARPFSDDEPQPLLGHAGREVAGRGAQHEARRHGRGGAARRAARRARPSSSRPGRSGRCRARRPARRRRRRSPRAGTARPRGRMPRPWPRWSRAITRKRAAERRVAREPVEVGGRRPAVEQHDDGRAGRAGAARARTSVPRPGSSTSAAREAAADRPVAGPSVTASGRPQATSTATISHPSVPVGRLVLDRVDLACPMRAAPSGEPGEITSSSSSRSSMWPMR